jgi:hypothetical protein
MGFLFYEVVGYDVGHGVILAENLLP